MADYGEYDVEPEPEPSQGHPLAGRRVRVTAQGKVLRRSLVRRLVARFGPAGWYETLFWKRSKWAREGVLEVKEFVIPEHSIGEAVYIDGEMVGILGEGMEIEEITGMADDA